jgi:hypothetical protein
LEVIDPSILQSQFAWLTIRKRILSFSEGLTLVAVRFEEFTGLIKSCPLFACIRNGVTARAIVKYRGLGVDTDFESRRNRESLNSHCRWISDFLGLINKA